MSVLVNVSLQEFTAGELTSHVGPLHSQVDDEIRRREQLLNVRQQLAQQVMEKSKDAGRSSFPLSTCLSFNTHLYLPKSVL